jgi:hypothetical protein
MWHIADSLKQGVKGNRELPEEIVEKSDGAMGGTSVALW